VLLAGVVSMVVGFLWYSPVLFGKPWMKLMGINPKNMKDAQKAMGKQYGISFLVTLLSAYVLFHTIVLSENYFHYDRLSTGLISAFWMWLGFVAPVQLTDVLFGGKKLKLFAINTGYQLASLLAIGVVLAMF
jgi:disulfide bond formation protein DsbB